MKELYTIVTGNEYGDSCLTDAYNTSDIADAYSKLVELESNEDVMAATLYEFNFETMKYELLESFCNE